MPGIEVKTDNDHLRRAIDYDFDPEASKHSLIALRSFMYRVKDAIYLVIKERTGFNFDEIEFEAREQGYFTDNVAHVAIEVGATRLDEYWGTDEDIQRTLDLLNIALNQVLQAEGFIIPVTGSVFLRLTGGGFRLTSSEEVLMDEQGS